MKRWVKRVALGVFVSLVLTTLGIIWDWYATRRAGQKKLDAAIAMLDAEDPGWRLHDLNDARNAKLPPDDKNGAVVVQRAVALIPKEFNDWLTKNSDHLNVEDRNRLPGPEIVVELDPILKSCQPALDLLKTLPTMPPGGNRITIVEPYTIDTSFEAVQKMREAVSLLSMHAFVALTRGDVAAAVEDCQLITNIFRCIGDEPSVIPQLVRMALAAVAVNTAERLGGCGEPKAGLLEIQTALADEIRIPRYEYGLRGDRATFYQLLENLDSGALSIDGLNSQGRINDKSSGFSIGFIQFRQFMPDQQADYLAFFSDVLLASKRGFKDRRDACEEVGRKIRSMTERRHTLVRLMFPAIQKVEEADSRNVAQLGCAVAGIACERYRQKFGSWPKSLADIPKDILPEIPTDPFTGNPVLFKRTATGAVVYSVGKDGIDDGGELLDPKMPPGTDVGFRLFDPVHRRLPAKPKDG